MASISPTTLSCPKSTHTSNNAYCKLTITSITQTGGATNQTTINYKITVEGTPWVYLHGIYVTLGGVVLFEQYKNVVGEWTAGQVIKSGSVTFNNASDGSLTLKAYMKQLFYYGYSSSRWSSSSYTEEASTNMVCSQIPRYATSNQSLNSKTETTIKMNWSSDNTVDYLWYSKDNGSNWTGIDVTDGTSGTYTISGLSANTTYKIKTRVRRKDSQLTTDSSALSVTTYDYPYITSVGTTDLTIGNSQTLTLYNPLSRSVTVDMYKDSVSGAQLYTGTTSDTSITFTPTDSTLYASIPNTTSGKCVYSVIYSNVSTKTTSGAYTYLLKGTETPSFSTFTYKDTNSTVTNVTGNDQVLVNGLSTLQVEISSANKMVAKNSATAKNYVMSIDNLSKTVDYSTSDITAIIGTVTSSGTKRLNIRAYDSRNLSTLAYKDITVYDYAKPVINASITRLNNFEAQTTIKISGTYTKLTIGDVDKNTITNVQYRYRESGDTWSNWATLTTTVTSGKFSCSDVILSLDNAKSFEFEIQAIDKLQTTTNTSTLDIGQAVFFISSNKRTCYINNEEVATLNKLYPVGSIYMSVNNTDPSELFGGTWEQITGRFLYASDTSKTVGGGTTTESGGSGTSGGTSLSVANIPSHTHSIPALSGTAKSAGAHTHDTKLTKAVWAGGGTSDSYCVVDSVNNKTITNKTTTSAGAHTHTVTTTANTSGGTGSGTAHTHSIPAHTHTQTLPPYFTVYCWYRIA